MKSTFKKIDFITLIKIRQRQYKKRKQQNNILYEYCDF